MHAYKPTIRLMETFTFINGEAWVHDRDRCAGTYCCIHNPSLHPMIEEPMVLAVGGLVGRLCVHNRMHPDPDSVAYFESLEFEGMGSHECDGCCSRLGDR